MIQNTWHINVDMGEGLDNEALLMPLISACNIACGGHAGDEPTMRQIVRLALQNKVAIGAHPSFPDRENFGRKIIPITSAELLQGLTNQLNGLYHITNEENAILHHVKPHGALYNVAAKDPDIAKIVLDAMHSLPKDVKLLAPFHSVIAEMAIERGTEVLFEAFGDRTYHSNLSLVSRNHPKAIILKPESVFNQLNQIASKGSVMTLENETVSIKADTFCIHGDHPQAENILKYISERCTEIGIGILKY